MKVADNEEKDDDDKKEKFTRAEIYSGNVRRNKVIEYKGNSRKNKSENEDIAYTDADAPKVIKRIVKGKVFKKKKSFGQSFSETFFGGDIASIGQYILYDVLIPSAKTVISEIVQSGIEMALFGEAKSRNIRRDKSRSYVSYTDYSKPRHSSTIDTRRDRFRLDEIILEHRSDAEQVLDGLVDILDQYDAVSVADLYEMIGMESSHVHNKYGWENLSRAEVLRVREGYLLSLPRPIVID